MNPPRIQSINVALPVQPRPPPGAGAADVWLLQPRRFPAPPAGGADPTRFQRRFALRLLLGAYLGLPGKDVALIRDARGKPGLGLELAGAGLEFSLSHSGDWLLLAVSHGQALGVDLEVPRQIRRPAELARRYFSVAEGRQVTACDEPLRTRTFLRLWTAKEAVVKAAGTGLAGCLDRVVIALEHDGTRLSAIPDGWVDCARWQLAELPLPHGLLGHLASPAALRRITVYHLT